MEKPEGEVQKEGYRYFEWFSIGSIYVIKSRE